MPKRLVSLWGLIAVGIYLLATVGIAIYGILCESAFCSLVILIPVFPWIFIFGPWLPDSILSFVGIIILNSLLIYFIVRYFSRAMMSKEASVDPISQY
jgi:hypothetical protein